MTTTIKHVTLKSLGKNKDIDPSKGTVTNPFTQEEYNSLCNTGEWPGGYVEAMGYVAPPMMDGMGDGSGSGDDIILDDNTGIKIQEGQIDSFTINDVISDINFLISVKWETGYTGTSNYSIQSQRRVPDWSHSICHLTAVDVDSYTFFINELVFYNISPLPLTYSAEWVGSKQMGYSIKISFKYELRFIKSSTFTARTICSRGRNWRSNNS